MKPNFTNPNAPCPKCPSCGESMISGEKYHKFVEGCNPKQNVCFVSTTNEIWMAGVKSVVIRHTNKHIHL